MYFWSDGIPKPWLDKCLKSPVWEDPVTSIIGNGPKSVKILTRAPLTYLPISLKLIQYKKISLSCIKILRNVC